MSNDLSSDFMIYVFTSYLSTCYNSSSYFLVFDFVFRRQGTGKDDKIPLLKRQKHFETSSASSMSCHVCIRGSDFLFRAPTYIFFG